MPRFRLLLVATLGLASPARADDPPKKYELVTPKDDGILATGINSRGDVVGFEWSEEKKHPGVFSQVPFYARGKTITYLPLLKGYTATFPAAVSDDGLVVGRSSKPAPPNVNMPLRNQAFVWEASSGIMRGLGTLDGDLTSIACGVTRDGRRISGMSLGPNRMRACVWDRAGDDWKVTAMPHESTLGSQVVAISDDGQFVTAVDGTVPCLWSRGPSGAWTREVIGPTNMLIPRAVNNSGTVVGFRRATDGQPHAALWSRDSGYKPLTEPTGYTHSEALAVNNAGVVVGMMDGPHGGEVGPNAFVYEKDKIRVLTEGGPTFSSATAINDKGQVSGIVEQGEQEEAPPKPGADRKDKEAANPKK